MDCPFCLKLRNNSMGMENKTFCSQACAGSALLNRTTTSIAKKPESDFFQKKFIGTFNEKSNQVGCPNCLKLRYNNVVGFCSQECSNSHYQSLYFQLNSKKNMNLTKQALPDYSLATMHGLNKRGFIALTEENEGLTNKEANLPTTEDVNHVPDGNAVKSEKREIKTEMINSSLLSMEEKMDKMMNMMDRMLTHMATQDAQLAEIQLEIKTLQDKMNISPDTDIKPLL